MINGHRQSDGEIVPEKFPNNSQEAEGMEGRWSGRQGCNPVGESPTLSIARVGQVAIPQLMIG